jgi:hypothetical protein
VTLIELLKYSKHPTQADTMNRLLCSCATLLSILLLPAFARATFITLQPGPAQGKDAQVHIGQPTTNLGNFEYLTYSYTPGPADTLQNFGLIEFDLSSVPASSAISAKLILFHEFNSAFGAIFDLFRNTSAWDGNSVTWNSQPTHDPTPTASVQLDFLFGIVRDWDITTVVNEWLSGSSPNYGLTLARRNANNPFAYFASSDHPTASFRPRLILEISDEPPPSPPPPTSAPAPASLVLAAAGTLALFACKPRRRRVTAA